MRGFLFKQQNTVNKIATGNGNAAPFFYVRF